MNKKEMKRLNLDKLFKDSEDNRVEEAKINIEVLNILLSIEGYSYKSEIDFEEQKMFNKSFVGGYKKDIKLIIKKDDGQDK